MWFPLTEHQQQGNNSSPPPRHQSDPRQPSLRFSPGRSGAPLRVTKFESDSSNPTDANFIFPANIFFIFMSDCACDFFLPVFYINNNKKRAKKEKKKTFIWFHQTVSRMLTKSGFKKLKQKWEKLCVWHRTFVSLFAFRLSCCQTQNAEIFISSRTRLNLGSWALNYSLLPTDKPGLRSGGPCCHREHKKLGLRPRHSGSHRPQGNKYITMETVL